MSNKDFGEFRISAMAVLILTLVLGLGFVEAQTKGATVISRTDECLDGAWEKVIGMRPENSRILGELYAGDDSQGIVTACFDRCQSQNCSAFIVDLERSACTSVRPDDEDFVPAPNSTYYHRVCLKVPESCRRQRLWQVERSLGAVLIDPMARPLPQRTSRLECYEICLNRDDCKAAQFRTSRDLTINDTIGQCKVLKTSRGTKPQAYRASWYKEEYLETQCHNISKKDYCSYAEFRNSALPYSDVKLPGLSAKDCESRCDRSADGFLCRAYGMDYSVKDKPTCYLHSVDTLTAGVSSLVHRDNSVFKEREPCIDMTVHCTNWSLTIELRTSEPFSGRLYAMGFSESCGVTGNGSNLTRLVLPLPEISSMNSAVLACGLTPAYSIDERNQSRAVIWSTVIVQFNPIIQRLGDQAIRVGCALENNEIPEPQNVSVNSGFTFVDSNAGLPPIASTIMNTYPEAPTVTMQILDSTLNKANVTHIGQKLILKIKISPNQGPFDIMASHLIASTNSGDSSLLLLDELGCPVTQVFPGLIKDPADNRSLIAEFNAFKFPSSQHVRFNVIVKFCLETCKPVKCGNEQVSFGRRKRRAVEVVDSSLGNVTELYKSNKANNKTSDELPLYASIIVRDAKHDDGIFPKPLISSENPDTFIIVGSDYMNGQFCMNSALALFIMIFLLIVQIILLLTCILAVRAYRKMAKQAEDDRADILTRHYYGLHGDAKSSGDTTD